MRKLRIDGNAAIDQFADEQEPVASERKLRMQIDSELKRKADRLLALKNVLSAKKKEAKALETEISALQAELLSYGKENLLERMTTDSTLVEFTSRVQRKIDPKEFLVFLQGHGRTKEFYDFVDVPIGKAVSNFGEAVLEASGVIHASSTEYAGLKVSALK